MECQKLRKKYSKYADRRAPLVLVHDGVKLMSDPEAPNNNPHFCEPMELLFEEVE